MPTYEQESNAGGLDRRYGMYVRKDASAFWDLDNVYIDVGGQIARRAPLRKPGSFDALSFGLFPVNGALTTLAVKGTTPSLPAGVVALYFDVPYGATAHVVKDVVNLGDTIIALIAHTISSHVRYFLHVFDGAPDLFTYVTDPAFPWMHEIDPTVVPVMTAAASKVWISDKYGDVYHSAVNKPRVWNTLTRDQLVAHGHEVHLYCPASGSLDFTIPFDKSLLVIYLSGYAAWIVEKYTGTGHAAADYQADSNWTILTQVNSAPAANQCAFAGIANNSTGATYTNWTKVSINAAAAGWFRVRIFPPQSAIYPALNYVLSGAIGVDTAAAGFDTQAFFRGDGATKVIDLDAGTFNYVNDANHWIITLDGVIKTWGVDYVLSNPTGNQARITFTAAPANQALIGVALHTETTTAKVVVPPGVLMIRGQKRVWGGAYVDVPVVDGSYLFVITIDNAGNPTGLSIVTESGDTHGDTLYSSVVVLRYLRASGVPIYLFQVPAYAGALGGESSTGSAPGVPVAMANATSYMYRDVPTDLRLYNAVGSLFGFADAGFLPTSKDDLSGGPVTLLASARNRLLVMYARGSLLWTIFTDPSKDVLADTGAIGTDGQNTPHGVDFFGAQIVPTARGLRLADLGLRLTDMLDDENLGSPVDGLGFPQFMAGTFWPYLSHYVAAVTIGGSFCFLVLSYHKQEKISAWSRFPAPAGVSSVDARSMVPLGSKLYFRSGTALYYFDGAVCEALKTSGLQAVGTFKDDNDSSNATAYSSAAEPLLNKLGKPRVLKRYRYFGLSQTGRSKTTFKRISGSAAVYQDGPTLDGDSFAKPRVRLAMRAEAIAPRMVSNDTRGWRVELFNYEFDHLGNP